MPSLFRAAGYIFYFWAGDGGEPIHVHVSKGKPVENATKFWITKNGGCILAHNKSRIEDAKIKIFMDLISAQFFYICSEWKSYFKLDKIIFYC